MIRKAATVALLRPAPSGLEVLLLRRARSLGFFGDAWVFPGGRVDDGDAAVACRGALDGALAAAAVAAAREALEEAGIWLGSGVVPPDLRGRLLRRETELRAAPEVVVDLDRLVPWSRWVTPPDEPRRYDTVFFVAAVSRDHEVAPDGGEVVAARWWAPSDALAAAEMGELALAPPTYRTLAELKACGTVAEALERARRRSLVPIQPILETEADGSLNVVLPGDPRYPSDHPVEPPTLLRLAQGRWWRNHA